MRCRTVLEPPFESAFARAFESLRRPTLVALLACALLASSCTGVPDPRTAPDNYLRWIGFDVAHKERVLLRWRADAMPLSVHLPSPPDDLFEDDEATRELVRKALLVWDDVIETGMPSFEFVERREDADIPIVWSSRPPQGEAWYVAKTHYDIIANAKRFGVLRLMITGRWDGGEIANDAEIRARVMHEVGHALGLGHSPDLDDVMYPRPGAQQLSARDRETLRLLYASPNGRRMLPSRD